MKSTTKIFPDLDWARLGEDAAKMVEGIKKKKIVEVPPPSKEPGTVITDAEVPVTQANAEVQKEEPQRTDSTHAAATAEVASKTPIL